MTTDKSKNFFRVSAEDFKKIPGSPIAYWISNTFRNIFSHITISAIGQTRNGMTTGNNDRFLRLWYEVAKNVSWFNAENTFVASQSGAKWFPYNKGGEARRWYGNFYYLINWKNDGAELKQFSNSILRNKDYYFNKSITWSLTNSSKFGARFRPYGSLFDVNGMSLFLSDSDFYVLGILNSHVSTHIIHIINPTISNQAGDIDRIPIVFNEESKTQAEKNVKDSIQISQMDWDSYETSWDFQSNPLIAEFNSGKWVKQTPIWSIYDSVRRKWAEDCEKMRQL